MGNAQSSSSSSSSSSSLSSSGGSREEEEAPVVAVEMSATTTTTTARGTRARTGDPPSETKREKEEEKNEEALSRKDEEKGTEERDGGDDEDDEEELEKVVASCRVCLEPIRRYDVLENNSSLLGCSCVGQGIHLNKECGVKYIKNLRRPNQTLTTCEVCKTPMSEFAEKIQPVLASTTSSASPFALHDSDGFLQTFSRPRRRPTEWCEFFCFLIPCLPCIALASTNCFHSMCVSVMRFRAYIFFGIVLALLIIFLSDVYLTMENKYESRVREHRKDREEFINNNNNNNNNGMSDDYYSRGGWNSFYYDA